MKSTPLRWSSSCWMQVARMPSASISRSLNRYRDISAALRGALHLLVIFGDGEAALLVNAQIIRFPGDFRVDHHHRLARVVALGNIQCEKPPRLPHLNGREPDARASYIVSNMSSTKRRRSLSTPVIGEEIWRRRVSGRMTSLRMLIGANAFWLGFGIKGLLREPYRSRRTGSIRSNFVPVFESC